MAVSRLTQSALAAAALLSTVAVLALEGVLTSSLWAADSSFKAASLVGTILQAILFFTLTFLTANHFRGVSGCTPGFQNGVWFCSNVVASILAAAASLAALIPTSQAVEMPATNLGLSMNNLLMGVAVSLGFAFAAQLVFFIMYFIVNRWPSDSATAPHSVEDGGLFPEKRVKGVPYDKTHEAPMVSISIEQTSRHRSNSTRSATDTLSSIHTANSRSVRHINSKTRLLSNGSKKTARSLRTRVSLDSLSGKSPSPSSINQDGFDSWDTSAVEYSRPTALEPALVLAPRGLETIPASPTVSSRSPSPGRPLDLARPKMATRSRSYSPMTRGRREQRPQTPELEDLEAPSELHIHPLFRSDSPTPPPQATRNTIVVAAPDAGKTVSERSLGEMSSNNGSRRSVNRLRSSSQPLSAGSPLSHTASTESFRKVSPLSMYSNCDLTVPEVPEWAQERALTPPIPEWVLSAGSRTSLTEYTGRKLRDQTPPAEDDDE